MTTMLNSKKLYILGGGTNTHISNHLALSAPAYGKTARKLASKFRDHSENKMDVQLILTKMASIGNFRNIAPDTPEDIEVIVDRLVADPDTKVIIFNVAMVDYKPTSLFTLESNSYDAYNPHEITDKFSKYAGRLNTSKLPEVCLELSVQDKIIQKIRKERKDILLVGFKTTCGATKEEQFNKGLKLCKEASANIVFVNGVDKDRINFINDIDNFIIKLMDRLQNHFCYTSNIFEDTILNNKIRITDEFNYRYSDNVIEYKKQLKDLLLTTFQNNGIITSEESSYWYNTRDEALDALVQMVLDRSHLTY